MSRRASRSRSKALHAVIVHRHSLEVVLGHTLAISSCGIKGSSSFSVRADMTPRSRRQSGQLSYHSGVLCCPLVSRRCQLPSLPTHTQRSCTTSHLHCQHSASPQEDLTMAQIRYWHCIRSANGDRRQTNLHRSLHYTTQTLAASLGIAYTQPWTALR